MVVIPVPAGRRRSRARHSIPGLRIGPFLCWDDFCRERQPFGLGMTSEEVEALIEAKPLAQQLAADPDVKPLVEHGGDRTATQDSVNTLKARGAA